MNLLHSDVIPPLAFKSTSEQPSQLWAKHPVVSKSAAVHKSYYMAVGPGILQQKYSPSLGAAKPN